MANLTCFAIFTQSGLSDWTLDLIESTKGAANKHKRALIWDYGFEAAEVKVQEFTSESVAYRALDLMQDGVKFKAACDRAEAEDLESHIAKVDAALAPHKARQAEAAARDSVDQSPSAPAVEAEAIPPGKRSTRRRASGALFGYVSGKPWAMIAGCGIEPYSAQETKAEAAFLAGRDDYMGAAWE